MKYLFLVFITAILTHKAFAEISLNDLSFNPDQLKIDPQITQMMEVRQTKLQIHQKLGLITMASMTATILLADKAKENDAHKFAGIASGFFAFGPKTR